MLSKLLTTIGFCICMIPLVEGQSAKQFDRAALASIQEKDYYSAVEYYRQSLERKKSLETTYHLAEAAHYYGAHDYALDLIEELYQNKGRIKFEELEYLKGINLFAVGQYKEAKKHLQSYLTKAWINKDEEIVSLAKLYLDRCQSAIYYNNLEVSYTLADWNFLPYINSLNAEFAFQDYGNKQVFSSTRANGIFVYENQHIYLKKPHNLKEYYELTFFQILDAWNALTCICESVNTLDRRCSLVKWNLKSNLLETLGGIFDLLEYSISQPYVDKTNNLLFFVSENFNNKGAKDIFYISLDSLNTGEAPKPVGINTAYNEESPFVMDNTLYFSSDRPLGLGGFDIYRSNNFDSDIAYNLGKQVNSAYDEKYYSQYEQMQYLSSNKPIENKTELGFVNCYNIYSHQIEEEKPIPVKEEIVINKVPASEDLVVDETPETEEEPTSSTTKMLTTFESIQSNVFFSNNSPAVNEADWDYGSCLKTYQKLYNDYLSNTVDPIAFEDFFSKDVLRGFEQLNLTLDSLENLLEGGLKLEISVKAFTSPRASSQYNLALGQRRCQSVESYIEDWLSNKELNHHLEDGSLKIITQSMGESTSPTSVSSDILNRALSVYAVDASYERRVEFELKKQ